LRFVFEREFYKLGLGKDYIHTYHAWNGWWDMKGRQPDRQRRATEEWIGQMLSLDTVFEILADDRCRAILYCFIQSEGESATLDELTEAVSVVQSRCGHKTGDEDLDSLAEALVDDQIPRLLEAGIIECDPRSETIRYWSQPTLEEYATHAGYQECDGDFFDGCSNLLPVENE
jgi:hypothetical protein